MRYQSKRLFFMCFLSMLFVAQINYAQEDDTKPIQEFELELSTEIRYFFEEALYEEQEDLFPSVAIKPNYNVTWNDGYESLNFSGFFRWDRDNKRTHWDVRELYYQKAQNNWEFNIGLKKIFWGVTESVHLVDIINQTDQVESFDGEQKLGQPMVQYTIFSDKIGTFDFFYLPYFRRRSFPGEKARLRFSAIIEDDSLGFDTSAKEWFPSFAMRWSQYFGIVDLGISQYFGTGREPIFSFSQDGSIEALYPKIYQAGLDLQITHDAFLWKLESIYRYNELQDFFSLAAGLEYTFSNVNGKGLDIGVVAEYLFDSRDELTLSGFQNDIFVGSRLAFNDVDDSSFLMGGIYDLDLGTTILSLEGSKRFGNSTKVELELRWFTEVSQDELILANFRNDSFIKCNISRFF